MDLDEYQKSAMSFANDLGGNDTSERIHGHEGLIVAALGLAGEAGEFSDHVKKYIGQGHELDLDKLDKEAGDVLWYVARYATWRGKSMSQLGYQNIDKLSSRYPEGFSTERSLNRALQDVAAMTGALR